MNEKQKTLYDEMVEIFNRFNAADEYLFATPLWNFGIPYKLKHYIDLLSMPGTLFGFDPSKGYIGLLKNKRATIVSTAAIFMPGLSKAYGSDYSTPFLKDWLNFAGIDDIVSVWFYGTKMRDEKGMKEALEVALGEARAAAIR